MVRDGPTTKTSVQPTKASRFPCPCRRTSVRGDVWYDCKCFQGSKKTCPCCRLPKAEQDTMIAATMREWGWDKNPSPGMRDYLTPGWRPAFVPAPEPPAGEAAPDGGPPWLR